MEKIVDADDQLRIGLTQAELDWEANINALKRKQKNMFLLISLVALGSNNETPPSNTAEDFQACYKAWISYKNFFEKIQEVEKILSKLITTTENIKQAKPHELKNIQKSNVLGLIHKNAAISKDAAALLNVESREKQTTINSLENADELSERLSTNLNPTIYRERAANFIRITKKTIQAINSFTARIQAIITAAKDELEFEYRNYIRYSQTGMFMDESLRTQWFNYAISPFVTTICIQPDLLNTFESSSIVKYGEASGVAKYIVADDLTCSEAFEKVKRGEEVVSQYLEYFSSHPGSGTVNQRI